MQNHAYVLNLDFSGSIDIEIVQRNVLAALQQAAADGAISHPDTEVGLDKIEIVGPTESYHWKVGTPPDDFEVEVPA